MATVIRIDRPPSGLRERIELKQLIDRLMQAQACVICGRHERHATKEVRPTQ